MATATAEAVAELVVPQDAVSDGDAGMIVYFHASASFLLIALIITLLYSILLFILGFILNTIY